MFCPVSNNCLSIPSEERRLVEDLEPTLSKTPVLLEQLAGYTGCEKFIQNVRNTLCAAISCTKNKEALKDLTLPATVAKRMWPCVSVFAKKSLGDSERNSEKKQKLTRNGVIVEWNAIVLMEMDFIKIFFAVGCEKQKKNFGFVGMMR